MALRDWSAKRIATIWAGWLGALAVLLVVGAVVSPEGVSVRISPSDLPLWIRAALGVAALGGACLPPAVLSYVWYLKRVRAWGEHDDPADHPLLRARRDAAVASVRANADAARQLAAPSGEAIVDVRGVKRERVETGRIPRGNRGER